MCACVLQCVCGFVVMCVCVCVSLHVCACVCVTQRERRLYGYWIILNLDPSSCSCHISFHHYRFGLRPAHVFEQLSK